VGGLLEKNKKQIIPGGLGIHDRHALNLMAGNFDSHLIIKAGADTGVLGVR
jgi:hypothetical protein